MEIKISFKEMLDFLTTLGFTLIEEGAEQKEITFGKPFLNKNLIIFIRTGFDEMGQIVNSGAVRCLLKNNKGRILWALTPVKRGLKWKECLGQKIKVLEELIDVARTCPSCDSDMIPSVRIMKPFSALWVCMRFPYCLVRREIHQDLQQKLAKETKLPKKIVLE